MNSSVSLSRPLTSVSEVDCFGLILDDSQGRPQEAEQQQKHRRSHYPTSEDCKNCTIKKYTQLFAK